MNDIAQNYKANQVTPQRDEYDEASSFIFRYMNNCPGMYATYSQSTKTFNQMPQIVHKHLTEDVINKHLHADHESDLIAIPTVNVQDDTCRFALIEITGIEGGSRDHTPIESAPNVPWFSLHDQAIHIYYMLRLNGIAPILCESPSVERYQIWVVLDEPMPASQLSRFGDAVLACCRHRMPASTFNLYQCKECSFHGQNSCRDILTEDVHIEVYPSSQHPQSQSRSDLVPLPCILENSFDYMEDGYTELDCKGKRIFMGGLHSSDNHFDLHLNSPTAFDPKHFVYDPVMTSAEFKQGQFGMSETPMDKVLVRLKGVQRSGCGFKACCPAHIDFTRSLSVSEDEEGNVQLCCSKGCSLDYILKSLDPSTRDWLMHVDRPRSSEKVPGRLRYRYR